MSIGGQLVRCKEEEVGLLPELVENQKDEVRFDLQRVNILNVNDVGEEESEDVLQSSTDVDSDSEGFSSSGGEDKARTRGKRKQVKQACINCRSAHAGCEDQRPCCRCIRLGRQSSCQDAPRKKRSCQRKADLNASNNIKTNLETPQNHDTTTTTSIDESDSPALKWEATPKKRVNLKQKQHKKSSEKRMKFYTSVLQPVASAQPDDNIPDNKTNIQYTVRIPTPLNPDRPSPLNSEQFNPQNLPTLHTLHQPLLLHPDVLPRGNQTLPPISHNYSHGHYSSPSTLLHSYPSASILHSAQGLPYTSTSGSYIIKEVPVTHTVVYRTIIHQPQTLPQIGQITKDLPRGSAFNVYNESMNNGTYHGGQLQHLPVVIGSGYSSQGQHLPQPVNMAQQYQPVLYSVNGHH